MKQPDPDRKRREAEMGLLQEKLTAQEQANATLHRMNDELKQELATLKTTIQRFYATSSTSASSSPSSVSSTPGGDFLAAPSPSSGAAASHSRQTATMSLRQLPTYSNDSSAAGMRPAQRSYSITNFHAGSASSNDEYSAPPKTLDLADLLNGTNKCTLRLCYSVSLHSNSCAFLRSI